MSKIINYIHEKFSDFKFYCVLLLIYFVEMVDNIYCKIIKKRNKKWYDQ